MTAEELEKAVQKLIGEANEESEAAKKKYEAACLNEQNRALAHRTVRSTFLDTALKKMKEEYDALVLKIQRELDESLEALYAENEPSGGGGDIDTSGAPYEVDYTLSMRDRYIIVKNYYLGYDDPELALADLEQDEVAKDYLGNYYGYLVQLLLLM